MKHPLEIENYDGSLKKLARDVSNLRYDKLFDFLKHLFLKIQSDSLKDKNRDRHKLAALLYGTSISLENAANEVNDAWINICKDKMEEIKC